MSGEPASARSIGERGQQTRCEAGADGYSPDEREYGSQPAGTSVPASLPVRAPPLGGKVSVPTP